MLKKTMLAALTVMAAVSAGGASAFAAQVGAPAPDFQVTDINGHAQKLSSYKGKLVVLEWHNQGCPYVRKHYESGNMERLQRIWTKKGAIWLTIISSAPGKQGYVTPKEELAYLTKVHAKPTSVILDPKGALGRLYDAKTTPHMFVINKEGTLVYNGAIDDKESTDAADIPKATNYVAAALSATSAGVPVKVSTTRPYGCGVKY